jgi:hypothetical protein
MGTPRDDPPGLQVEDMTIVVPVKGTVRLARPTGRLPRWELTIVVPLDGTMCPAVREAEDVARLRERVRELERELVGLRRDLPREV